jgi:hypothetical protein
MKTFLTTSSNDSVRSPGVITCQANVTEKDFIQSTNDKYPNFLWYDTAKTCTCQTTRRHIPEKIFILSVLEPQSSHIYDKTQSILKNKLLILLLMMWQFWRRSTYKYVRIQQPILTTQYFTSTYVYNNQFTLPCETHTMSARCTNCASSSMPLFP